MESVGREKNSQSIQYPKKNEFQTVTIKFNIISLILTKKFLLWLNNTVESAEVLI